MWRKKEIKFTPLWYIQVTSLWCPPFHEKIWRPWQSIWITVLQVYWIRSITIWKNDILDPLSVYKKLFMISDKIFYIINYYIQTRFLCSLFAFKSFDLHLQVLLYRCLFWCLYWCCKIFIYRESEEEKYHIILNSEIPWNAIRSYLKAMMRKLQLSGLRIHVYIALPARKYRISFACFQFLSQSKCALS